MSEQDDNKGLLNENVLQMLETARSLKDSGVNLSKEVLEALDAIEATSKLMDTIMTGKQVDLAYYKLFADSAVKRIKRAKRNKALNSK